MGLRPARYYDRSGHPITLLAWARLCEDKDYCLVSFDMFAPFQVATSWIGLDHCRFVGSEPVIFETLVMRRNGASRTVESVTRYSTEWQARRGHETACSDTRKQSALLTKAGGVLAGAFAQAQLN